jgi:hypothetical protein
LDLGAGAAFLGKAIKVRMRVPMLWALKKRRFNELKFFGLYRHLRWLMLSLPRETYIAYSARMVCGFSLKRLINQHRKSELTGLVHLDAAAPGKKGKGHKLLSLSFGVVIQSSQRRFDQCTIESYSIDIQCQLPQMAGVCYSIQPP